MMSQNVSIKYRRTVSCENAIALEATGPFGERVRLGAGQCQGVMSAVLADSRNAAYAEHGPVLTVSIDLLDARAAAWRLTRCLFPSNLFVQGERADRACDALAEFGPHMQFSCLMDSRQDYRVWIGDDPSPVEGKLKYTGFTVGVRFDAHALRVHLRWQVSNRPPLVDLGGGVMGGGVVAEHSMAYAPLIIQNASYRDRTDFFMYSGSHEPFMELVRLPSAPPELTALGPSQLSVS